MKSAFKLTSLDGTSVADLATRLEVTPAIRLTRTSTSGKTATLTPANPLAAGTTYRFALRRPDGTIAGTWAITAARALHVVGSLPGDGSTGVPRNTGIEVSFDQPGVTAAGVRDHFSITPKVSGTFEVHGKVVAFVPSKPLQAFTLYTVTISKGVPLPGTGQELERDATFRFETKGTGANGLGLVISDTMTDSATRLRPTISLYFSDDDEDVDLKIPESLPLTVHRLGGLTPAMRAYERLAAEPEWAYSAGAPIDTDALTPVLEATVKVSRFEVEDEESRTWVQLPQTLPAGWYIATLTWNGRDEQAILQVTDLAVYAMVTETRTAVWVNALDDGTAVAGAEVSVAGSGFGRTDERRPSGRHDPDDPDQGGGRHGNAVRDRP